MEDLEARPPLLARRRGDGTEDPGLRPGELLEQVPDLRLGALRVCRQVADRVGDLRARRRDELVEDRGGRVALARTEVAESGVEVGAHDLLRASELRQRG